MRAETLDLDLKAFLAPGPGVGFEGKICDIAPRFLRLESCEFEEAFSAAEIDRRGGCPGRRDGERGHGRSRVGEAEVQNWNVAANLI
jgi:hypothetical protein